MRPKEAVQLRLSEWTLALILGVFFGSLAGPFVPLLILLVEVRHRIVGGNWMRDEDNKQLVRGYRIVQVTALIIGMVSGVARLA